MIQFFRKKSNQRKIFIGLILIVVPGFLFWGVMLDGGTSNLVAGTIDGDKIRISDFIRSYEALNREMLLFQGIDLSRKQPGLDAEMLAWQRIVMIRAAEHEDIQIENKDIVSFIQTLPFFSRDGKFSSAVYEGILTNRLRTPARTFEEDIRGYLMIAGWRDKVRARATVSDEEVRELFSQQFATRDLEYVVLTDAQLDEEIPEATDEDVKGFADAMRRIGSPEKSVDELRGDLTHRMKMGKIAEKAIALRTEAESSGLEEAAKAAGLDIHTATGHLPGQYLEKIGELPLIDNVVQRLEADALSQPVPTSNGYAVIRVTAVGSPDETLWEEKKEELEKEARYRNELTELQTDLSRHAANVKINPESMKQLFPAKYKSLESDVIPEGDVQESETSAGPTS